MDEHLVFKAIGVGALLMSAATIGVMVAMLYVHRAPPAAPVESSTYPTLVPTTGTP